MLQGCIISILPLISVFSSLSLYCKTFFSSELPTAGGQSPFGLRALAHPVIRSGLSNDSMAQTKNPTVSLSCPKRVLREQRVRTLSRPWEEMVGRARNQWCFSVTLPVPGPCRAG